MTADDLASIDAYLDGELTGSSLQAFEHRLAAEPAFSEALANHRTLREVVYQYGRAQRTVAIAHEALRAKGRFDPVSPPPAASLGQRLRQLPQLARQHAIALLIALLAGLVLYFNWDGLNAAVGPAPPSEPVVHFIPYQYQEDRLKALNTYLQYDLQMDPYALAVHNSQKSYHNALNLLQARMDQPVSARQQTLDTYYAALLCLYALEKDKVPQAAPYLQTILPRAEDAYERSKFGEAYIIALLRTKQYAQAKAVYAANPNDYFFQYPAFQAVLKRWIQEPG
jgi:hypothetical protein